MYLIPTTPLSIGGIKSTGVLFKPKKGSIKIDQDKRKYLEIVDKANNLKSYWFCNEIIFYRK